MKINKVISAGVISSMFTAGLFGSTGAVYTQNIAGAAPSEE